MQYTVQKKGGTNGQKLECTASHPLIYGRHQQFNIDWHLTRKAGSHDQYYINLLFDINFRSAETMVQ
jgi:hypothetical protein